MIHDISRFQITPFKLYGKEASVHGLGIVWHDLSYWYLQCQCALYLLLRMKLHVNPRPAGPSPTPALCWGGGGRSGPGGGGRSGPPSISVTKRLGGKIQPAMERPGRDLSDKVLKFYLGVTCDVTGHVPFIAFPPQNSENKRISSLWIDMIWVCDISKHRPKPKVTFSEVKVSWGHLRSNCRFRSFGVVAHVYGSVFRLEREKWLSFVA